MSAVTPDIAEGDAAQPASKPESAFFERNARFAIYYAPPADSAWWQAGCAWLGRDPATDMRFDAPQPIGLSRPLAELSQAARGYGWHATLSAPFRCGDGVTAADLARAAEAWALAQQPFMLPVRVGSLGRFVAVQAASDLAEAPVAQARIQALAASAVRFCAPLRLAPTQAEIQKRRASGGLTPKQDALLLEWGYPYVFDEFRFHMTLSDPVDSEDARIIVAWWQARLEALGPLPIDGAAIYVQAEAGAPFRLWRRLPFGAARPVQPAGAL